MVLVNSMLLVLVNWKPIGDILETSATAAKGASWENDGLRKRKKEWANREVEALPHD